MLVGFTTDRELEACFLTLPRRLNIHLLLSIVHERMKVKLYCEFIRKSFPEQFFRIFLAYLLKMEKHNPDGRILTGPPKKHRLQ